MSPKKIERKKNMALENIQTLVPKNLNISKFKLNHFNVIDDTKKK